MRSNHRLLILALAGVALLSLAPVAVAASGSENDVLIFGRCTGNSETKIKLSPENRRIEVEFEVDDTRAKSRWDVTISQNGSTIFTGVRRALGPPGDAEFQVRILATDNQGTDSFSASATRLNGAESCTASASIG